MKNPATIAQQAALWLLCLIVGTIPLLFGAVHPIVLGGYVFLLLVGLGGWLVFTADPGEVGLRAGWCIVPLILIGWLVIQAIPLPFSWVEVLSPQRAERMAMVNELAGADVRALPLSENGPVGLYRSFLLLALIIFYYSLTTMIRRNKHAFRWLFYCIVAVGLIEAVYGLMQFVNPGIGVLWLNITGRAAHGTIIYKNQFASLLNMIWPLAVAGFAVHFAGRSSRAGQGDGGSGSAKKRRLQQFFTVSRVEAILLFAVVLPMLLAVLFSLSRGGILAMLLVAVLLIVLLPFAWKRKLLFLGLFVGLLGAYGSLLGLDTISSRFSSISGSGETRLEVYLLSLPILWDHWLTGIGLESYTLLSPIYLTDFPANTHFDRVHNEYLELTLELGLPMALLFFGWLAASLAVMIVRISGLVAQPTADPSRLVIGVGAFCGLLGFLAHGLVDFGWRLPANLVYAVTLLAIIQVTVAAEDQPPAAAPHPTPSEEDRHVVPNR